MSFAVFADGSANLPQSLLEGISLLPCEYTVDGKPVTTAAQLKPGQKITTIFLDGTATSTVEDITITTK